MKKPSERTVQMTRFLLATPGRFVTVRELSDELDVSEKTIKRELSAMEKWLSDYALTLNRKPGAGLMLEGEPSAFESVRDAIESFKAPTSYSRDERRYFIISELLLSSEPIKLFNFASRFKVTEGTLSHDLDLIEGWLEAFHIKLMRKPGYGIYVEGTEKDYRAALIHLLHESVDEYELIRLVRDPLNESGQKIGRIQQHIRNRLLNLVEDRTIVIIEKYLTELEERTGMKLTDSAFIGLAVHLALAIERIKKGQRIIIPPSVLSELRLHPDFNAAQMLVKRLEEALGLTIPEDEVGYITMHLKGAETRIQTEAESEAAYENVSFELVRLARKILKEAEAETGFELKSNSKLFYGFISHLGPAIERLRLGLDIRNPLLSQIKEQYATTYKVAKKCAKVLEDYLEKPVPEAEIGYIALHIGAMSEYAGVKYRERPVRVLIVCASGMGTSSLLQTRIRKEFPSLQVVDAISAAEISELDEQVDLVISTVDLTSKRQVVRVSPLLGEADMKNVRTALEHLEPLPDLRPASNEAPAYLPDTLEKQKNLIQGIQDLMNNLVIEDQVESRTINELIDKIARQFTNEEEEASTLSLELHDRERLGETILSTEGIFLLHCRSTVIHRLALGIIRFKEPLTYGSENDANLYAAIILLAPKQSERTYLEAASEVSKSLIDRPGFAIRLSVARQAALTKEIQGILKDLYLRKMEQYTMEVEQI
ncbi:BglG family transcription antiterminator [Paenibacillus gallinarum]|uniref:BglG family transcription antiterminator n=1 Tax=Paenibacillus gallinarum TaxID=2762232 RepID=A0ABR8T392_9BACL|nr:PRD domain-containing protein [Paenibacillus gallinarum]MBD7970217.1 BglG family transcription antiterminator [Paenibacillus gallinarum]